MSTTDTLIDLPLFRLLPTQRHSDTINAAEETKSAAISGMWAATKSVASTERSLLTFLINKPRGLSDHQIARRLQVKLNVAREVRASLVEQGFVVSKGGRNSRAGKALEMWALVGRY